MSKMDVYNKLFTDCTMAEIEGFTLFNMFHHHYRPFNCALILVQRPGARMVMTEYAWDQKGYSLKPEATPIVILQPGGPVNLLYDKEDVYSRNKQLRFDGFDDEYRFPEKGKNIDELTYERWKNAVHSKGIRVSENRSGEARYGRASSLNAPMQITFAAFEKGVKKTKSILAHHQIVINSSLPTHEKALTILHELGHLYCGHVPGKRTDKNGLPPYRFEDLLTELKRINAEQEKIRKQLASLEASGSSPEQADDLKKRADELNEYERRLIQKNRDPKEYEAELVCKILSQRNNFQNDSSEEYLKSHSPGGKIPDISLESVMEAVEKIAGILDI